MRAGLISRALCGAVMLSMCVLPNVGTADTLSGVGDLSITTLDGDAQSAMRINGALGVNRADAVAVSKCAVDIETAQKDAQKITATVMTPSDPVKKFNSGIGACMANIQTIAALFNLPTSWSITAAFEAILKALIKKLVDEIVLKICVSATGAWNSTVDNAVKTLNSGTNDAGIAAFGS